MQAHIVIIEAAYISKNFYPARRTYTYTYTFLHIKRLKTPNHQGMGFNRLCWKWLCLHRLCRRRLSLQVATKLMFAMEGIRSLH